MGDFDTLHSTSANLHHHKKALTGNYTNIQRVIAHSRHNLDVTSCLLDIELLLLSLAISIQDAISFSDFYCFASNQTGNTVLFAGGVQLNRSSNNNRNGEQAQTFSIATIFISLGFFILGVLMTGQVASYFKIAQMRGWLVLSNALSTTLVYITAALQWRYYRIVGADTALGRIILGMLAFSSGLQVAVVRGLKITDSICWAYIQLSLTDWSRNRLVWSRNVASTLRGTEVMLIRRQQKSVDVAAKES